LLREPSELWAKVLPRMPRRGLKRSRVLALLAWLGGDAKSGTMTDEAAAFGARPSLPSATAGIGRTN
jgi:hypothetical protein